MSDPSELRMQLLSKNDGSDTSSASSQSIVGGAEVKLPLPVPCQAIAIPPSAESKPMKLWKIPQDVLHYKFFPMLDLKTQAALAGANRAMRDEVHKYRIFLIQKQSNQLQSSFTSLEAFQASNKEEKKALTAVLSIFGIVTFFIMLVGHGGFEKFRLSLRNSYSTTRAFSGLNQTCAEAFPRLPVPDYHCDTTAASPTEICAKILADICDSFKSEGNLFSLLGILLGIIVLAILYKFLMGCCTKMTSNCQINRLVREISSKVSPMIREAKQLINNALPKIAGALRDRRRIPVIEVLSPMIQATFLISCLMASIPPNRFRHFDQQMTGDLTRLYDKFQDLDHVKNLLVQLQSARTFLQIEPIIKELCTIRIISEAMQELNDEQIQHVVVPIAAAAPEAHI